MQWRMPSLEVRHSRMCSSLGPHASSGISSSFCTTQRLSNGKLNG